MKIKRIVCGLVMASAILMGGATPSMAASPAAGGGGYPTPPPGAPTMTDAEMDAVSSDSVVLMTGDVGSNSRAVIAAAGDSCDLKTGRMWTRSSSKGEPYGGVGAKPELFNCTPGVVQTRITSEVWMHNGWIWFRAAGPVSRPGQGNMVQKNLTYVCKGTGKYPFKVKATGWGKNSRGQEHAATVWSAEYKFSCG